MVTSVVGHIFGLDFEEQRVRDIAGEDDSTIALFGYNLYICFLCVKRMNKTFYR